MSGSCCTGNTSDFISIVYNYECNVFNLYVSSESVSKALSLVGGESAKETAKFVAMMDKFFDTLNVTNFTSGK